MSKQSMTPARASITGAFSRSNLVTIVAPIAWSGTTSQEDRDAAEADLAALRDACVDALDESGGHTVHVERGDIVTVDVETAQEEEETADVCQYDEQYTALALRGLTIRRAGQWALINDGVDVWLTRAKLSVSPAKTEQEMLRRKLEIDEGDGSEAYTDLCDHLIDHVAMSASREAGICNEADVLEAVRAGLLGGDDARLWWDAGELVDGIWVLNGERVDDDGAVVSPDDAWQQVWGALVAISSTEDSTLNAWLRVTLEAPLDDEDIGRAVDEWAQAHLTGWRLAAYRRACERGHGPVPLGWDKTAYRSVGLIDLGFEEQQAEYEAMLAATSTEEHS